ncbi:MAG: glycosyltransferase family 1 protein, partial [Calditrichaeota bacterium]
FEGSKTRKELCEILSRHKYAIQGRYIEPFGLAAAEACKLGCLTFVSRRSGVGELIDDDILKFDDFEELSHNFNQLLDSNGWQQEISERLQSKFSYLSPDLFQQQLRSVILQSIGLNMKKIQE